MKKTTASVLLILIMFGLLGISLVASGSEEKNAIAKGMKDFNYMTPLEFEKGQFVEGLVFEVYGEFAYRESYRETLGIKHDSKVTSHYYLIPMTGSFDSEAPLFIALELKSGEAVENAELLLEQTMDYQYYDTEPEVWNEFIIQGKIKRLSGEIEDYLYDWLTNDGTDGTRADYEDMICPYVISERTEKSVEGDIIAGIIMCTVCFGAAAVMLIIFLRARASSGSAPAAYTAASYTPVNGNPAAEEYSPARQSGSFGNTTSSGSVPSPSDGGESARLMEEMNRLSQPADADEFFSKPIPRKNSGSDDNSHSGLGIGIGDDEK